MPLLMINDIWQFLCLAHINSNVYAYGIFHSTAQLERLRHKRILYESGELFTALCHVCVVAETEYVY